MLERTYKLAEENNSILRGIRRSNRFGTFVHILYWVLIIGASVGAFYYIQPYIESVMSMYTQAEQTIRNVGNVTNQAQDALNSVKSVAK